MANSEVYILFAKDEITPWVVYQNNKPHRLKELVIKTSCKAAMRDLPDLGPTPVLVTLGTLYEHFSEPKGIIQSSSLPRPY